MRPNRCSEAEFILSSGGPITEREGMDERRLAVGALRDEVVFAGPPAHSKRSPAISEHLEVLEGELSERERLLEHNHAS